MESYSCKTLTYESDILPALAGLASRFASVGGTYYAGLWEHQLLRGLTWSSARAEATQVATSAGWPYRSKDYLAPSFSWAAFLGPKKFQTDRNPVYLARVVNVACNPAGTNAWGAVKDGYLRLSGPFLNHTLPSFTNELEFDTVEDMLLHEGTPVVYLALFEKVDNKDFVAALILKRMADSGYYQRIGLRPWMNKKLFGDMKEGEFHIV